MMLDEQDRRLRHPKTLLTGKVRAGGSVVQVTNPHGEFWVERDQWRQMHGIKVKPGEVPPGAKRRGPPVQDDGRD